MRPCRRCGQPLPAWKRRDARYCTLLCRDRERRGRATRTRTEPRPKLPKTCPRCGKSFEARAATRYCGKTCRDAAGRERDRRRKGLPLDKQERVCDVCGVPFVSVRAHQVRCSQKCSRYLKNQRTIDKKRKTDAPPRISAEMIATRAAAIRAGWDDETRYLRRQGVPLAPGDTGDEPG